MIADYVNEMQIKDIIIKRVNPGYYQFGTKFAKVKNNKGKIAVLAGGGYTSLEEYINNVRDKEVPK